jgi:hypothetical protein
VTYINYYSEVTIRIANTKLPEKFQSHNMFFAIIEQINSEMMIYVEALLCLCFRFIWRNRHKLIYQASINIMQATNFVSGNTNQGSMTVTAFTIHRPTHPAIWFSD